MCHNASLRTQQHGQKGGMFETFWFGTVLTVPIIRLRCHIMRFLWKLCHVDMIILGGSRREIAMFLCCHTHKKKPHDTHCEDRNIVFFKQHAHSTA